jgi:ribosome-associated toxin RatA of RatAB toxin-antitoxin module
VILNLTRFRSRTAAALPCLPAVAITHSRVNIMPIWRSKRGFATRNAWVCLLATMLLAGSPTFAADSPIRSIDVAYDGDTYVLNAVMFAPVAQSIAWDVLTDFDHMAQWVPNVSESKVLKREDTTVTIEQRGVAKYGAISFPYTTERKIELKPQGSINSTQLKGSLRRVVSTMVIEPDGKGTRLTYHLEIVPSLLASALLSKDFLQHELGEQFGAIIGEMVRRAPPS